MTATKTPENPFDQPSDPDDKEHETRELWPQGHPRHREPGEVRRWKVDPGKRLARLPVVTIAILAACGDASTGDDLGNDVGSDAGSTAQDPAEPPFADCAGGDQRGSNETNPVCFAGVDESVPTGPIAVLEHEFVDYEGTAAVHVILTLDPTFVDNTYGEFAVGWDKHSFKDLVGSDHAQILLYDASGELVFDLKLDYLSEDSDAPCGYSSGGVVDGDGKLEFGDEGDVLAWNSSLARNLNERGYCDYLESSPESDAACSASAEAPDWDFRVVYEVWVTLEAFAPAGFGSGHMEFVHASPSKGADNTIEVAPTDCPEDFCNDPDGCEGGSSGECSEETTCGDREFCLNGQCRPIVD